MHLWSHPSLVILADPSLLPSLLPPDEALLVANQFVVSFDGHLYELPGPCPVILAHDVTQDESFTVLLGSDSSSQRTLLVRMNNSTVAIHHNGEVQDFIINCSLYIISNNYIFKRMI